MKESNKMNKDLFSQKSNKDDMYRLLDADKTNHVMHLIISIVTFGAWTVVWACVAGDSCIRRNRIRKEYGHELENNSGAIVAFVLVMTNFWYAVNYL